MKKIISLMLCVMVLISTITLPVMAEEQTLQEFTPTNYSRQLMVKGNQLVYVDDPATAITLRGINVPSMGWGMREHLNESLIETYDNWNSNIIRLPITAGYWFGDKDETTGEYTGTYVKSNTTYYVADYRKAVDDMVRGAQARGKYIILDNHGYVLPEEKHLEMFKDLVALYGNNPAVLFGVLNEPHGKNWDQWYNGDPENGYVGHQYMVEQIRDLGAKNILVIGGLSYAYNIGGILGIRDEATGATYELTDCGSNGDTSKTGYGIMYDTHIYPVKGTYSNWVSTIGEMRKKYPILVGEWGWDSSDSVVTGNTSNVDKYWEMQLMNWMDDHYGDYDGIPMNWTAWNMHMSSTPKMITGWSFKPTSYHGQYVKDRLLGYDSTALLRNEVITVDFDKNTFRGYGGSDVTNTADTGKLTIAYKANKKYNSQLKLPVDWDINGVQTFKVTVKGPAGVTGSIGLYGTDQELYSKEITYTGEEQVFTANIDELEFNRRTSKVDGVFGYNIDALRFDGMEVQAGTIEVTKVEFIKSANPTMNLPVVGELPANDLFFDMEDQNAEFSRMKAGKGASSADTLTYAFETVSGYDGKDTTALKISYNYSGMWSGDLQMDFLENDRPAGANYFSCKIKGSGVTNQKIQLRIGDYSVYPELAAGDEEWHQFIFDISDNVDDPSFISMFKIHLKNKVNDYFYIDDVAYTKEMPERVIADSSEEVGEVIKTLTYDFERSLSYKHDVALNTVEGSEGDSISHMVVKDGCFSTKADYITYTRGSGKPATAIISYNNNSDFFKANHRKTWAADMAYTEDVVFDVKSLTGPQKIKLALHDSCSIVSDYLEFDITDEWRRIRIPVASFTDTLSGFPMRPAAIRSYYFQGAEANTTGAFLVDNITLTNDPNLPGAESYVVEYVNTFDGEDLFTANGGGWESSSTRATPDAEGDYFGAEYEPHSGVLNSGAMHVYNNWGKSDNTITITGFPTDWDFSKALYIGAMIKSSDMYNGKKKIPYTGKIICKLYNGENLTGTATLYYSAGVWNWAEAAFGLNTKLNSADYQDIIAGSDKMVLCTDALMQNDFYIDDLTFSYVPLKAKKDIEYPADYRESFSIVGSTISTEWDKASTGEGFIKNVDNAGLVGDHGATIQFVYTDAMKAEGKTYVYFNNRDFWDIRRGEYFTFAASLMTDSSRSGRWKTKNINTHYPFSEEYCNETLDVTFAMVDVYGNVYKAPAVTLTTYDTTYYKVPVDGFADEKGNKPDLNMITQMRIYPDTDVVGGCFWFDEFGFKNDAQYISSIVSDFITTGVNAETDSVTVNFVNNAGTTQTYTIISAVYNKRNMKLYDIQCTTDNITADKLSITLNGITLPEANKDDYMIKFFVWDGDANLMDEHYCEFYLPATVDY